MDYSLKLSKEFNLRADHSLNIISLIDEGNTIPFIARYRKEMTGSCDDQVLREFSDRLKYLRNLDQRKEEIANAITEQGKMTDEIAIALASCETLTEAEDIYRPFKQKRKTRASVATEKGLAPLADAILLQELLSDSPDDFTFSELRIEALSDEKLFRFLLQKLKERIVVIVVIVFALVSVSYMFSDYIEKQNTELSTQISKNRKVVGKADDKERTRNRLYSKMASAVDEDVIFALDRIVVLLPAEIRLTSAEAQSDILKIEGVFESSDALSETIKSVNRQTFVADIEASRIDTDSNGNRIFTLRVWLQ